MSIALDVGPLSLRTSTQHAVSAAAAAALNWTRAYAELVFGKRVLHRAELDLAARAHAFNRGRRPAARWWIRMFVLVPRLCWLGIWLWYHALRRAIAPKLLARQVAVAALLQCAIGLVRGGTAAWGRALATLGESVGIVSAARRRALLLRTQLAHARTYDEHVRLCEELDMLEGGAAWRGDADDGGSTARGWDNAKTSSIGRDRCRGGDDDRHAEGSMHALMGRLQHTTRRYEQLVATADVDGLAHHLRFELRRGLWGLTDARLWRGSRCGTKLVVGRYLAAVVRGLSVIHEAKGSAGVTVRRHSPSKPPLCRPPAADATPGSPTGPICRTGAGAVADANANAPSSAFERGAARNRSRSSSNGFMPRDRSGSAIAAYNARVRVHKQAIEACSERLRFFTETRHSFGRSALLLSGGAHLGLYHCGVVKTLVEHQLLPTVLSGASAGSVVAGIVGCSNDDELMQLLEPGALNLHFFEALPAGRTLDSLSATKGDKSGEGGVGGLASLELLDSNALARAIRPPMRELTFREAYERTGRIINITVSHSQGHESHALLLNYLTTPNVFIWSASLASCAIPGVYAPVALLAKGRDGTPIPYAPEGLRRDQQRWSDGSVVCDLPMQRLSELFNVNNFVVSQVNPHARVFSQTDERDGGSGNLLGLAAGFADFLKAQVKCAIKGGVDVLLRARGTFKPLKPLGVALVPLITQRYEGDITIFPAHERGFVGGLGVLLKNPTPHEFARCLLVSQRATWATLPRIRAACAIEFALDRGVRALRQRLRHLQRQLQEMQPQPQPKSQLPSQPQSWSVGHTQGRDQAPAEQALAQIGYCVDAGASAEAEDADVQVEVNMGAMGADVAVDTEGADVGAKMRSVPSFYSCRSHTDLQKEAQRHAHMPHLSDDA